MKGKGNRIKIFIIAFIVILLSILSIIAFKNSEQVNVFLNTNDSKEKLLNGVKGNTTYRGFYVNNDASNKIGANDNGGYYIPGKLQLGIYSFKSVSSAELQYNNGYCISSNNEDVIEDSNKQPREYYNYTGGFNANYEGNNKNQVAWLLRNIAISNNSWHNGELNDYSNQYEFYKKLMEILLESYKQELDEQGLTFNKDELTPETICVASQHAIWDLINGTHPENSGTTKSLTTVLIKEAEKHNVKFDADSTISINNKNVVINNDNYIGPFTITNEGKNYYKIKSTSGLQGEGDNNDRYTLYKKENGAYKTVVREGGYTDYEGDLYIKVDDVKNINVSFEIEYYTTATEYFGNKEQDYIDQHGNTQPIVTITRAPQSAKTNYKHSQYALQINKFNDENQPISGAEFSVIKRTQQKSSSELSTNSETVTITEAETGKFGPKAIDVNSDQEHDVFEIIETNIPDGYIGFNKKLVVQVIKNTNYNIDHLNLYIFDKNKNITSSDLNASNRTTIYNNQSHTFDSETDSSITGGITVILNDARNAITINVENTPIEEPEIIDVEVELYKNKGDLLNENDENLLSGAEFEITLPGQSSPISKTTEKSALKIDSLKNIVLDKDTEYVYTIIEKNTANNNYVPVTVKIDENTTNTVHGADIKVTVLASGEVSSEITKVYINKDENGNYTEITENLDAYNTAVYTKTENKTVKFYMNNLVKYNFNLYKRNYTGAQSNLELAEAFSGTSSFKIEEKIGNEFTEIFNGQLQDAQAILDTKTVKPGTTYVLRITETDVSDDYYRELINKSIILNIAIDEDGNIKPINSEIGKDNGNSWWGFEEDLSQDEINKLSKLVEFKLDGNTINMYIGNTLKNYYQLNIKKVDKNGNLISEDVAEFSATLNGNQLDSDLQQDGIQPFETNHGIANLPLQLLNNQTDTYVITETKAPMGYVGITENVTVTVDLSGVSSPNEITKDKITCVYGTNDDWIDNISVDVESGIPTISVTIQNNNPQHEFTLHKEDMQGNPLFNYKDKNNNTVGARFTVYRKLISGDGIKPGEDIDQTILANEILENHISTDNSDVYKTITTGSYANAHYNYRIEEVSAKPDYLNILNDYLIIVDVYTDENGNVIPTDAEENPTRMRIIEKSTQNNAPADIYNYVELSVTEANSNLDIPSSIDITIKNPIGYLVQLNKQDINGKPICASNVIAKNITVDSNKMYILENKYSSYLSTEYIPIELGEEQVWEIREGYTKEPYSNILEGDKYYIEAKVKFEENGSDSRGELKVIEYSVKESETNKVNDELKKYISIKPVLRNDKYILDITIKNPYNVIFKINKYEGNGENGLVPLEGATLSVNDKILIGNGSSSGSETEIFYNNEEKTYIVKEIASAPNHTNILEGKYIKFTARIDENGKLKISKYSIYKDNPDGQEDERIPRTDDIYNYVGVFKTEEVHGEATIQCISVLVKNPKISFKLKIDKQILSEYGLHLSGVEFDIDSSASGLHKGLVTDLYGNITLEEPILSQGDYEYKIYEKGVKESNIVNILSANYIKIKVHVDEYGNVSITQIGGNNYGLYNAENKEIDFASTNIDDYISVDKVVEDDVNVILVKVFDPQKYDFQIIKESSTGNKLKNVKFDVVFYDEDGKEVKFKDAYTLNELSSKDLITDSEGIARINNIMFEKTGIYKFVIKETSKNPNYKELKDVEGSFKVYINRGKQFSLSDLQIVDKTDIQENNTKIEDGIIKIGIINTKIEEFDLSLRKFIVGVNGEEPEVSREPVVDIAPLVDGSGTTANYTHPKDALYVNPQDIVTYTIRVYNESKASGYAQLVMDDIPEGVEFVKATSDEKGNPTNINAEYKWVLYKESEQGENISSENTIQYNGKTYVVTDKVEEAKLIVTDYLSKENGEKSLVDGKNPNLIQGFDKNTMTNLDYRDLKVEFRVKTTNKPEVEIINYAQITDDLDEYGKQVDDRDSTPNKWIDGEDDQDIEKIKVRWFDLALYKWVDSAIVTEDGKTTKFESGHTQDDKEKMVLVSIDKNHVKKVNVKFEYRIKVKNQGKVAGYAKEIKDHIPDGLKFVAEDNVKYGWKVEEDGSITTDYLKDTLLNPGETAELTMILTWVNGENNLGQKINYAEISKDFNDYGDTPDIDSTPDNFTGKSVEDDEDDDVVMLQIKTGSKTTITYIVLSISVMAIIGLGCFGIKKFVLK